MAAERRDTPPGFTMKIASKRSGLSPHVIRIWERRYGAVTPTRSDTNRRLFSEKEIERLILLAGAVEAGYGIGQIAAMATEELRKLPGQRAMSSPRTELKIDGAATAPGRDPDGEPAIDMNSLIDAVGRFDAEFLEKELSRALLSMSRLRLYEDVIAPLMRRIGELWQKGSLRVAHEHMASAVVRNFFGKVGKDTPPPETAPVLVVATPAGQNHEVGALIAEAAARSVGWRTIYLGASLPAEEIAAAARSNGARAVGLSIVYPPDDPHIHDELRRLASFLDGDVKILVGGGGAPSYASIYPEIGAKQVENLDALCTALNALR